MVKGLPRDSKPEEIMEHFDRLYDLSKEDWTYSVRSSRLCVCICV